MTLLNNMVGFLITLFFQVIFLVLIYFLLRLLLRHELGWKLFYALVSFMMLSLLAILENSSFLAYLLHPGSTYEERFVVRDGNSFVGLLLDLSFFASVMFLVPLLTFYFYTYLSGSLTTKEKSSMDYYVTAWIYLYLVIFIVVDQDLSVSAWDAILASKSLPIGVQVQPDLEFLFFSYRGEWVDFFIFVMCEASLFFVFFQGYFITVWRDLKVHLTFLLTHLFFIFYFFGGEGLLFDTVILVSSAFFFEALYFQLRLSFYLKTIKSIK